MDINSKKAIRDGIKLSIGASKRPVGGQSCGLERFPVVLKSEDLEIEISVGYFKSNIKNREYGMMLFDLIIDDLI